MKILILMGLVLSVNCAIAAAPCSYSILDRDSVCKRVDGAGFQSDYKCYQILLYQFTHGAETAGSPLTFNGCYPESSPDYTPFCSGPSANEAQLQVNQYINRNLKACSFISFDKAFKQNR